MAETAAADGVTTVACTPHIMAGVYDNDGPKIAAAVSATSRSSRIRNGCAGSKTTTRLFPVSCAPAR
jgi:hypothetical protein